MVPSYVGWDHRPVRLWALSNLESELSIVGKRCSIRFFHSLDALDLKTEFVHLLSIPNRGQVFGRRAIGLRDDKTTGLGHVKDATVGDDSSETLARINRGSG